MRNSVFAFVFLLSFLFCIDVYATITGTVTDTIGSPVSDALVTFTDESNPENTYSDYTDSIGKYELPISPILVEEETPVSFRLQQNYPNPFNPTTTIKYNLPQDSQVTLSIYNVSGQLVCILNDEHQSAGKHEITWDAKDMASGLYFCTLKANGFTETRKMVLVK